MSREDMRKLMEAVEPEDETSSFQSGAKGKLFFKGYPVYMLEDRDAEEWAFFAFAGPSSNLKEFQAGIREEKMKRREQNKMDQEDSRGTQQWLSYPVAALRLTRFGDDDLDLDGIPVVKQFTPKQIEYPSKTFEALMKKCEKMNPGRHFGL